MADEKVYSAGLKVDRLPPLEALRNELQQLRASPMVKFSGRAAVVDMVDAYLVDIDARLHALEALVTTMQRAAAERDLSR